MGSFVIAGKVPMIIAVLALDSVVVFVVLAIEAAVQSIVIPAVVPSVPTVVVAEALVAAGVLPGELTVIIPVMLVQAAMGIPVVPALLAVNGAVAAAIAVVVGPRGRAKADQQYCAQSSSQSNCSTVHVDFYLSELLCGR